MFDSSRKLQLFILLLNLIPKEHKVFNMSRKECFNYNLEVCSFIKQLETLSIHKG